MWQCVQHSELTILNHRVLVANSGTRIAVHTDKLAPQGFHSAFKLLPVLVDDVPIHDRSPLNITVCVSRCGHLDRDFMRDFRNQRALRWIRRYAASHLWFSVELGESAFGRWSTSPIKQLSWRCVPRYAYLVRRTSRVAGWREWRRNPARANNYP
jgi:hypothetical protein